jgi:hypothetical protein
VVLANSEDKESDARLEGLPLKLLERGMAVLKVTQYTTGAAPDQFINFYTTYNRTRLQQRVGDLLALCSAARTIDQRKPIPFRVILAGTGHAGLWAALAAPAADAVIADCAELKLEDDDVLLDPDLFCPGLRTIGTLEGAAMLAAPHPLLLHNTGAKFPSDRLRSAYRATSKPAGLRIEARPLADEDLVDWIARLKW